MPFLKPITKHGNSAGIILDQALLRLVGWEIGTAVEIHVSKNSIVLSRHKAAAQVPPPSPTELLRTSNHTRSSGFDTRGDVCPGDVCLLTRNRRGRSRKETRRL